MIEILIAIVGLAIVVAVVIYIRSKLDGRSGRPRRAMDRELRLREAEKLLTQSPTNVEGLSMLGDVYFEEEAWDKAMPVYESLSQQVAANPTGKVYAFDVHFRYGYSAMQLSMSEQAYKGLSLAHSLERGNFEVNHNLGILEFERKNYEKAIAVLRQAQTINPESPSVLRYMGHALFRTKQPKEAMTIIRKAIDLAPDDKESLFTLAECYYEARQIDQALRIFTHLRPDPNMGPSACLAAGKIHIEIRQNDLAIQDYEMGLKHEGIKPDILAELRYNLATTYIHNGAIGRAIPLLRQILDGNPTYKDVAILLPRYQELNANKNLHIFLMATSADFVALCRRVVMSYYPKAKVKITDISVHKNEWADILAEINTPKISDLIMFRFIRTQGFIGELIVRDFHSHIKDVKASKGFCITIGTFSEEAKRYCDGRPVEMIEKDRFTALLNNIDAKADLSAQTTPIKKQ